MSDISTRESVREMDSAGQALKLMRLVSEAKGNYALAFLDQTKIRPEEAKMIYGETCADGRSQFSVWFVKSEEWDELQELRKMARHMIAGENELAARQLRECLRMFPQIGEQK